MWKWFLSALLLLTFPAKADNILVGGLWRSYIIDRPIPTPLGLPIVLGFHGGYQQPSSFRSHANLYNGNAIVIYPKGRPALMPTWNAGTVPATVWAVENNSDDLAFVSALIDRMVTTYGADRSRVYVTGISNGGRFAWRIACETNLVSGVATIAGTMSDAYCPPVSHPDLLVISGTSDSIEPYEGGGSGGAGIPFYVGVDLWTSVGGDVTILRPSGGHTWEQPEFNTTEVVRQFFGLN
jgi:polyhydroxybutyrate depolymerase